MIKQELFENLDDCFNYADKNGILKNIQEYQKKVSEEDASRDFAEYIYRNYTTVRADAMASLMQMMIQTNPNLALLKFPVNFLFRAVVIKGSIDLYKCFIEEAVEPFLKGKKEEKRLDYYLDLYSTAIQLNDQFFPQYTQCIKGLDFNGAFADVGNNPDICLINKKDYDILDDVVEKYNAIIGRRDIINDLEERGC